MISVLIAGDHPIYREGLAGWIESDPRLSAAACVSAGPEAVDACIAQAPRVVVLDLPLRYRHGVAVLEAIRRSCPGTSVIVLSAEGDPGAAYRALRLGAAGYLLKDLSGREVCEQIVRVTEGAVAVPSSLHQGILHQVRASGGDGPLSDRELEVLRLVAGGRTNPEIATILELGTPTVKTYLARLCQKLGASDRTSAVAIATERGLIRNAESFIRGLERRSAG